MSFRRWVKDHRAGNVYVREVTEVGAVRYRRKLHGLRHDYLVLSGDSFAEVAHVLSISVDGDRLRCVLAGTDNAFIDEDEPSEPFSHGGEFCSIHDEARWRLWSFELDTRNSHGKATTYKTELLGPSRKRCPCGRKATAYIHRYEARVFIGRVSMCHRCGMKENSKPQPVHFPPDRITYHYQRQCPKCNAWLPATPTGWKEVVLDPDDEIIGYAYLWVCVKCGNGWSTESTTKPTRYRWLGPSDPNLAGPELVESSSRVHAADVREPGSFEPEPIKNPAEWASSSSLSDEEANLIRAAWTYLDAVAGSDWLHEVRLIWGLKNTLIDQDMLGLREFAFEYLTEVAEGSVSSEDPARWRPALAALTNAYEALPGTLKERRSPPADV